MESNKIIKITYYSIYCAGKDGRGFNSYWFKDIRDLEIIDNETISFIHKGCCYTATADAVLGSEPFATLIEDYKRQRKIAAKRPKCQDEIYERTS